MKKQLLTMLVAFAMTTQAQDSRPGGIDESNDFHFEAEFFPFVAVVGGDGA